MIFKPKFFLDLSGGKEEQATPATVAPVREKAAPAKADAAKTAPVVAVKVAPAAKPVAASQPAKAEAAPAAPAAPAASAPASGLTTAEAIAAELAAAQANRPAPSLATFATEALVPGGANPRRRRSGGANLAGFKAMARSFVKN